MDFTLTDRETHFRDRVKAFIDKEVRPRIDDYAAEFPPENRWGTSQTLEELKEKAKAAGLWNFFMPPHSGQEVVAFNFVMREIGFCQAASVWMSASRC